MDDVKLDPKEFALWVANTDPLVIEMKVALAARDEAVADRVREQCVEVVKRWSALGKVMIPDDLITALRNAGKPRFREGQLVQRLNESVLSPFDSNHMEPSMWKPVFDIDGKPVYLPEGGK